MFGARKITTLESSPYATRGDFCRIFQQDMSRLYRLSLLLTADHSLAEQCYVGGLHISQEGNPVFKDWAERWARRAIILNAIRMMRPLRQRAGMRPVLYQPIGDEATGDQLMQMPEFSAILELPVFERFAFVMSVLEGYSLQECSLLLSCTRGDVAAARARALEQLGRSAPPKHRSVASSAQNTPRVEDGTAVHLALAS